ncbi:MAG: hypothetical protein ACR2LQ_14155 [Acidimicrobiales bacterium]
MRTVGRIIAGLFMGAVLFLGFAGAAHGQTGSQSQSQSQGTTTSTSTTTSSTTTTTAGGGSGSKTGGTLAKTGMDLTVPLGLGGAALALTVVLRRVLANG